ncbi:MAG: hypothetical protein KDI71_23850 [Xanthomonadales bacterium]|nr:hypothetical protein [Xanthomonadales bacterium]
MKQALINVPTLPDLLALQSLVVECLYSCGMEINSAAKTEVTAIQDLWSRIAPEWTDAEGQRVAVWVQELEYAEQQATHRSQVAARSKCCFRIWRLLQRRLARRLDYDWPEGGLMLETPPRGRRASDNAATVDARPFHAVSMKVTYPPSRESQDDPK